jgi:predicted RNA binding protein YcfA (HicA-like mRNA interferase family)
MDSDAVIKAMKSDGWCEVGHKGSHKHFKHPSKPGKATVVHPTKDIPPGTLRNIERQTGLSFRQKRKGEEVPADVAK